MQCRYIIILLLLLSDHSIATETLRLGTSTIGGNYSKLGHSIDSILSINKFDENLIVLNTEGSVDNIFKLINNEIDIAIVQNDIAFFAENGLELFNESRDDLRGIITFFPEPIYLITNNPQIRNIEQLRNYKVNLGPLRSGLLADAKIILHSINIYDSIKPAHARPSQVKDLLISNEIQASFINNLNHDILENIDKKQLFIIPLKRQLIKSLHNTFPYFDEFSIIINEETISTVAVKAILICRHDLSEDIIYRLTKILYDQYNSLFVSDVNIIMSREHATIQMPLRIWHNGSKIFYNQRGILKSQTALKYMWLLLFIPMIIVFLFIIFNLSCVYIQKKYPLLISANSL